MRASISRRVAARGWRRVDLRRHGADFALDAVETGTGREARERTAHVLGEILDRTQDVFTHADETGGVDALAEILDRVLDGGERVARRERAHRAGDVVDLAANVFDVGRTGRGGAPRGVVVAVQQIAAGLLEPRGEAGDVALQRRALQGP